MSGLNVTAAEEKRVKGQGFLRNRGTDEFSARTLTVNGRLSADKMMCICEAAKLFGDGYVALTSRLSVECTGIPYEKIEDFKAYIAREGLITGGTGAKIRPIVSCKGSICRFGLADTFSIAEEMHKRFYLGYREMTLPHKFKITVGGCPNKCVKPDLNDVGVIGQLVPHLDCEKCRNCNVCAVEQVCPVKVPRRVDGVINIDDSKCVHCGSCVGKCPFGAVPDGKKGYKVFIGGRWGKAGAPGRALHKIFTDREEMFTVVDRAIHFFAENGIKGERFASTIERLGFDAVEKALLDGTDCRKTHDTTSAINQE